MDERFRFVAGLLEGEKMLVLFRNFGISCRCAFRSDQGSPSVFHGRSTHIGGCCPVGLCPFARILPGQPACRWQDKLEHQTTAQP